MEKNKTSPSNIVTITTDFGLLDPFAGIMKGVMLSINSKLNIIDISHQVPPQNICLGVYYLKQTYLYFPKGTIHLIVVDPGVGTNRKAIIAETENYYFVAPDNGILSGIFIDSSDIKVIHIDEKKLGRNISSTFHGRDVFAPAAAWLSKGKKIDEFGFETKDYITLNLPEAKRKGLLMVEGIIISSDIFGNLITNITSQFTDNKKNVIITFPDYPKIKISGLTRSYQESINGPSALINSWGMVEIFIANKNAHLELNIGIGAPVTLTYNEG